MRKYLLTVLTGAIIAFVAIPDVSAQVIPTKGKEFWAGFMENYNSSSNDTLRFFISSNSNTTGTLKIPAQGYSVNFSVTAFITTQIDIPNSIAEHTSSEVVENMGILIETQDTVSVFALNYDNYTADGNKVLPTQSLGINYRVSAYTDLFHSEFVIVATEDDTEIDITPTAATLGGKPAGVTFTVFLDRGESYQVQSSSGAGDFTGTTVVGTDSSGDCRPFAVFSGTNCVNTPVGCTWCDHIVDQNMPTKTWGQTFYVVPWNGPSSYTYRVLAHQNATVIQVNGGAAINLNAGAFYEQNSVTTPLCITANKGVAVTQYMQGAACSGSFGDPAMIILNSAGQKIDNVTFATVNSNQIQQNRINIVIETANIAQISLDGVTIPAVQFTAFTSCPTQSWAQIDITQGSHTLNAIDGFTAYIYGNGANYETYAYSAGAFDPGATIPIDSVYCTSDTLMLGSPVPLWDAWWSTQTDPNDTIGTGNVITLYPPIVPDVYIIHGSTFVSGCMKEYYFNVEIPDPPTIVVSQSIDTVCQYQNVFMNVTVTPPSSIYVYTWTPASGVSDPTIPNPVINPSQSGWYYVTVSSPNGCASITDSVYIKVNPGSISFYNGLTGSGTETDQLCLGDSSQFSLDIEQTVFEEFFDTLITGGLWTSISLGIASNNCGSLSGKALYFTGTGTRQAETIDLDVANGGSVQFAIKFGQGSAPCEDADFGEDVILEYSTNGGGAWTSISTYYEFVYSSFTTINVAIPAGAQTSSTRFRWRQVANSGGTDDNWALENIIIGAVSYINLTFAWSPATDLSNITIQNPVSTPTADIVYAVLITDTTTGCEYDDTVSIDVGFPFTLTSIPDTVLCDVAGIPLWTTPSGGTGHTFSWDPGSSLNDSTLQSPVATPTTTVTYTVTVTSEHGCVAADTINILVTNLVDLSIMASDSTLCQGDSALITALMAQQCGAHGNTCASLDSVDASYGTFSTTSSLVTPYTGIYQSSRRQYIFTAGELAALGLTQGSTFSELSINVFAIFGNTTYNNWTIKMGCTSQSTAASSFISGLTTVFTPKTIGVGIGWNDYVFDNSYDWDGSLNLVIEICYDNSTTSSNTSVYYSSPGYVSCTYQYGVSACNIGAGGTTTWRPNMKLKFCPTPAGSGFVYSWTPVLGLDNPNIPNPVATPNTSTTYFLTATDTVTGCILTDSMRINVGSNFTLTTSPDTLLCSVSGVAISVAHTSSGTVVYSWTPSLGLNNSTIANPLATPGTTTTYYIKVTSDSGCSKFDSVTIDVSQPVNLTVIPSDTGLCFGDTLGVITSVVKGCGSTSFTCGAATDSSEIQYGTFSSTSSLVTPFTGFYLTSKRQYLFTQAEMASFGMTTGSTLSELAFNVFSNFGSANYDQFTIKMSCTSLTALTSTYETGLATVFTPKNISIAVGWNYFNFDNTYNWDGFSNLIIEVCYTNTTTSSNASVYYSNGGFIAQTYNYGSAMCPILTGFNTVWRPNIKLKYCATPPNTDFTYVWTPSTGLDDPNSPTPFANPTTTTTYSLMAIDTTTGCVFYDSVTINVGPPFTITTSPDTVLCDVQGIGIYVTHTAGGNVSYTWTPGGSLSNSSIWNPTATPSQTIQYFISVTSDSGCTRVDSLNIIVAKQLDLTTSPTDTTICAGDAVPITTILLEGCGTNGKTCSGTIDSVDISYSFFSSTSTLVTPYAGAFNSSRRQFIFTQAELFALGFTSGATISEIGFNVFSVFGTGKFDNFTIKMGCTSLTALTTTYETGLQQVFNPASISITTGWNYHAFDNTYDWDGTSNIIIEICFTNTSTGSNSSVYYSAAGFTSTIYNTGVGACTQATGFVTTWRPNTKLRYCPTPPSTSYIYTWTPATDLSSSTVAEPTATPGSAITYTLTVTDTLTNCVITDTVHISITGTPIIATAGPDTTLCSAVGLQLIVVHNAGSSGIISWSPGANVSDSTIANPTITSTGSFMYIVTVTDSIGCAQDVDTTIVTVTPPPVITLTPDTTICLGDNLQLSASGGVSYSWIPATNLTATNIANPIANPIITITYSVTVTDTIGCQSMDSVVVTVSTGPTQVDIGNDTSICIGASVTFDPGAGYPTYLWHDGSSNQTFTGSTVGQYWVTVSNLCGSTTDTAEILQVFDPQIIDAGIIIKNEICGQSNGSITGITVNGAAPYTFSWDDGTVVVGTNLDLTNISAGSFTLTFTDSNGCSTTSGPYVVADDPGPSIDISNMELTLVGCGAADGSIIGIVITGGIAPFTFEWDDGTTIVGDSLDLLAVPIGNYTLTVTDDSGCTASIGPISIVIVDPVVATAWPNATIGLGQSLTIYSDGGNSYNWFPITGLSCTNCQNPLASPPTTTLYGVEVTDTTTGCIDTAYLTIMVQAFFVPDAFSPNGDGQNDIYYLYGVEVQELNFSIYDRWGELVFQSNDITKGWDGTLNGRMMNTALFVVVYSGTFADGSAIEPDRKLIKLIR